MPQLSPAPWLAILVSTWLVILIIIPPKILAHIFPNNPTPETTELSKKPTWAWPWP
uniref:ATP synthase complex subunit 8 n=1 Tax=Priacanthus macracanthus TaxID=270572 RepID=A0A0U2VVI7_9TELE|nr:ATP synthase F0 subunit 8 [Priacanthus macracanthus]ALS20276.1 ATP synthase F0 subunit 8 [Priacanthus macracanthus]BBU25908.1 ATPase subunit 8 [Priacanthus macracanthus]